MLSTSMGKSSAPNEVRAQSFSTCSNMNNNTNTKTNHHSSPTTTFTDSIQSVEDKKICPATKNLSHANGDVDRLTLEANQVNHHHNHYLNLTNFANSRNSESNSNQSGSDSGLGLTDRDNIENCTQNLSTSLATSTSISSSSSPIIANARDDQTQSSNPQVAQLLSPVSDKLGSNSSLRDGETMTNIIDAKSTPVDAARQPDGASPTGEAITKCVPDLDSTSQQDDTIGRRDIEHSPPTRPTSLSSNGLVLRSALKRPDSKSAEAQLRGKRKDRNVSFNQTVIVFCEEIETSSPSDPFEPPIGYQGYGESHEDPNNQQDGSRDRTPTGCIRDDLDILNKIVGKDALNLTGDQLFGLLENGSLLDDVDINPEIFSEDEECPANQINSNQGFVCYDAISDTNSESSMIVDDSRRRSERPNSQKANLNHYSSLPRAPKNLVPTKKDAILQSNANDLKMLQSEKKSARNDWLESQSNDCTEVSISQRASSNSQVKSMPARMKVSTVDSQSKRQPPTRPVRTNESAKQKSNQSTNIYENTRNIISQNPIYDSTRDELISKQYPIAARNNNVESMIISRSVPRNSDKSSVGQQKQINLSPNQDSKLPVGSQLAQGSQVESKYPAQIRSELRMESRVHKQTSPTNSLQQPLYRAEAQFNQESRPSAQDPACHVCRAIELNRVSSASFVNHANSNVLPVRANIPNSASFTGDGQHGLAQRLLHVHDTGVSTIDRSRAPLKSVSINPTCVSCREVSMHQSQASNVQQPPASINVGNLAGPQQPRSIACQLVYVVDQNGNRMRALQVVGPATSSVSETNLGRQILIAPNSSRFPVPNASPNQIVNRPIDSNNQKTGLGQLQNAFTRAQNVVTPSAQTNQQITSTAHQVAYMRAMNNAQQLNQRIPIQTSSAPRNHTIYYVRQPLGAQSMRQPVNQSAPMPQTKSFPDAHEIRRLDGIRAPAVNPEMLDKMSARDDADDPSFGFSSRPAVKVVSTSKNQGSR